MNRHPLSVPMTAQPSSSAASNPLLRLAFYGLAVGMALVHVFITFRGLSSPAGMEQAQVAREFARGKPGQSKVIRPHMWAQLEQAGKPANLAAFPGLDLPPVPALLWGGAFSLLEKHLAYVPDRSGSVYLLDRVIACIGVTGLLLTLLWTHGAARRLFDERVAAISVLALLLCEPLWQLAVSGSPVALVLPLVALAFRLLVHINCALRQGGSWAAAVLLLAATCAALVLTHWMAVWLVAGLLLAAALVLPANRSFIVGSLSLGPVLALAGWGSWMYQRCGDVLGGAKTLLQSFLLPSDVSLLERQFSVNMPPVQVSELLRKILANGQEQLGQLFVHTGYLLPALFFGLALMHRFKKAETAACRTGLAVMLGFTTLGMTLVGLPQGALDDNQLYLALAPALTVFGVAMLTVVWMKFYPTGQNLWTRHGYIFLLLGFTALPMLGTLPAQVKLGLTLGGRIFPHWPPYVPDRVSLLKRLVEPQEILFSDAPWFVAWYADLPAAWVPVRREDFVQMKARAEAAGHPVAGFVMTPVSAQTRYLHELFTGPYGEWPDLVFRAPLLAFDREFPGRADFEFKIPVPLVAVPVGSRENLSLQMTFYTNRQRLLKD